MGTFFTGVLIFDRTGKVALSERKTEGESHKVTVREVHLALGYRQHYFRCRKKNASLLPNFSLSGENKEPREGIEGPTATDDWRYVCASHDGAKFSSLLFARPTRVGIIPTEDGSSHVASNGMLIFLVSSHFNCFLLPATAPVCHHSFTVNLFVSLSSNILRTNEYFLRKVFYESFTEEQFDRYSTSIIYKFTPLNSTLCHT